jgi:hypothetical protein
MNVRHWFRQIRLRLDDDFVPTFHAHHPHAVDRGVSHLVSPWARVLVSFQRWMEIKMMIDEDVTVNGHETLPSSLGRGQQSSPDPDHRPLDSSSLAMH